MLQPHPTKKFSFSKATFESPYGTVQSGWERKNGKIAVNITVPPNAKATVVLQTSNASSVTEAGKALLQNNNIADIQQTKEKTSFEIGSGKYVFEYAEE